MAAAIPAHAEKPECVRVGDLLDFGDGTYEKVTGRLPSGHPERLSSWWTRHRVTDWIPPGVNRDLYLDTATALAIRKSQVRRMGPSAPAFYRDEADRLRAQLVRVLAPPSELR